MDFFNLHTYGYLFIWFIIYSFFGWVYESLWASFNEKQWVNRGFLSGPVIPIYGFGALLILFCLLRYYEDPVVIFVFGVIITSALEYFVSFLLEKIFHNKWWDYSNKKYNINGRICLQNSLAFGVLSLIIIYVVTPGYYFLFSLFDFKLWMILAIIFTVIFVLDVIYSIIIAYNLRNRIIIVEELKNEKIALIPVIFEKRLRESIEGFKAFPSRLLKAFPNLNNNVFDMMKKFREEAKAKKKELKKEKKEHKKDN